MIRTQEVVAGDHAEIDLYQAICADAAEAVDANLVSIWRFEDDFARVTCLHAYDARTGAISAGQVLLREQAPTYFRAILEETTVCAPTARTHPATRELTGCYLEPQGVESLLDIVVHRDFVPVGIICCESKGIRRNWSSKDRNYVLRLATFTSFRAMI